MAESRAIMSRLEKQIDAGMRDERVQMNRLHQQLNALKEAMRQPAPTAVPVDPPPALPRAPRAPEPSIPPPDPIEPINPPEPVMPLRPTPEPPSPLPKNDELPAPTPIPPAPAPPATPTPQTPLPPNASVGTGTSVDRLAMADSLYAADNLPFALQIYKEIAPTISGEQLVWVNYQIANSLRRLKQEDQAETYYREVASQDGPGWIVESARWWLSNRQQRKDIDKRLKTIHDALRVPTMEARAR